MKLDQFIKQTLLEITKGVSDAQGETLLFIAPGYVDGKRQEKGQSVSFEIAVTVSGEGGGAISVLGLGELKAGGSRETANRIAFEVPVYFSAPTIRNPRHYTNEGPLDPVAMEDIKS